MLGRCWEIWKKWKISGKFWGNFRNMFRKFGEILGQNRENRGKPKKTKENQEKTRKTLFFTIKT